MVTWFLTSKAGRSLLIGLLIAAAFAAAWWAVSAWEERVYQRGFAAATAEAEKQRKAYFDQAAIFVKQINEAAESAATRLEQANTVSGSKVDATVAAALKRWTKEPLIVMSEGKCKVSPDLGATWNEINRGASQ